MSEVQFNLTFGQALEALKDGSYIARKGWNGKGMHLQLVPKIGMSMPVKGDDDSQMLCEWEPFILMKTATGDLQPGWLASQPDMLSSDWGIVG